MHYTCIIRANASQQSLTNLSVQICGHQNICQELLEQPTQDTLHEAIKEKLAVAQEGQKYKL